MPIGEASKKSNCHDENMAKKQIFIEESENRNIYT